MQFINTISTAISAAAFLSLSVLNVEAHRNGSSNIRSKFASIRSSRMSSTSSFSCDHPPKTVTQTETHTRSSSSASSSTAANTTNDTTTTVTPTSTTESSSSTAAASSSTTSTSTSTNTEVPSYQQFCDAVGAYNLTTAGGNPPVPSQDVYNSYCDNMANVSLGEQAQFLANSIWETGGLQYMTELACNQSQCSYGNFYGRGYLMLTHDYNYQNASTSIYGDNSLYDNPNMAAETDGAWKTAMWFWNGYVHPSITANNAIDSKALGYSVMAINGGLECGASPSNPSAAQNRLAIYNQILKVFGLGTGSDGTLTGC